MHAGKKALLAVAMATIVSGSRHALYAPSLHLSESRFIS